MNCPDNKKKRSPVRREDIVDVAARLFSESGYEGTSVRTIASSVGLSVASLFHHFASKDALLEAVIRRGLEIGMADVVAGLEGKTTPLARLRSLVHVHIRLVNGENRHIHRVWTIEWLKLSVEARGRLEIKSEEYRAICHDTFLALFECRYIYAEPELSGHLLMPSLNWSRTWLRTLSGEPDESLIDSICAAFLNIPVEEFERRLAYDRDGRQSEALSRRFPSASN